MDSSQYQKIQLFLSARNLKDLDVFSKSDPYIKISFRRDYTVKQYLSLGKTQTINNNLNPTFSKSFIIDFVFESRQDIRFDVFDDDGGNDDFIGSVQTTVGALMGAKHQTSILQIKNNEKSSGKVVVRCDKVEESNEYFEMNFKGVKLMNTDSYFDFWDKSDPYLKFLKMRADNTVVEVARTNVIKDDLNPVWSTIKIQSSRLMSQNSGKFKVECWDWEKSGKDQFIGQFFVGLQQLLQVKCPAEFPMHNPKCKKPGKIVLDKFRAYKMPSFVDYLRSGMQLNMIIAIDFTGSNGMPNSSTSLHYMNPNAPNQYQNAIKAISNILLNFDSDKRIPSFGFGANTQIAGFQNGVSHCFPLSGNPSDSDALGMEHLMVMYEQALKNIQFSGPTYFGSIIQQAMNFAKQSKLEGSRCYQTLLILTDGQIHDMDKSIDLICQAAQLPLSIIIVGVGSANFANMVRLDGDGGLYSSNGKLCQRDLVQFVPFRDVQLNPDLLAKQLLAELPDQVVKYMQLIGKNPIPPQNIDIDQILSQKDILTQQANLNNEFGNMQVKAQQYNGQNNVNPYGNP